MTTSNFGFYFERSGLGAAQGAISPAQQFFEGSLAEASLVRETGQNSIDARAGEDPVRMVFELSDMATEDIPGIQGLREHISQVEQQTRGAQGHAGMSTAHQTAGRDRVPVLRISDYGTNGLTGSESINEPESPLSALTRGAGISSDDGSRGGSFGIGSAVGPMASDMSTVLYTSMPIDDPEVVLAGYSSLASHRDSSGTWRTGDGFLTDLGIPDDFRYLRNPASLGPFSQRTEPGTDSYILGYRNAELDPDLQHIKIAALRNFLLAIHRGTLVVEGITNGGSWRLDTETLADHVKDDPEAAAFYRAINDPNPITKTSTRLGKITLYIDVDDSLEKTLHTITTRAPLMRISTFRHTSIPMKYAAVLECSDPKGNQLLRALEPPQHNTWDAARAANGKALLDELKSFVREGLRSRIKQQVGDQVEIKGLSRYLPVELLEDPTTGKTGTGTPFAGAGTTRESSTVQGAEQTPIPATPGTRKTVRVTVRTSASDAGEKTTKKGKDRGGPGTRKSKGGGMPGSGQPGEGKSRINAGDVRFRSWSDTGASDIYLALTPTEDINGDLELVALGPGGRSEDDYQLPIASSTITTNGKASPLTHKGNTLTDMSLSANVTSQVRISLSSNHRYRLGIK
ncbi:hypothetical protein PTW37_16355 (plasmid) [Arthrobacter agilis]|uniref:hypothetical protein n=1 Tax=Arthrobacter agilis TaxID=37921 RepID=UPI0023667873|nr:hypothetical protein [Arthrobacter agilis]WDF35076.1 hypothetical protein PTW37_16355 [Arthrobacter agilis]